MIAIPNGNELLDTSTSSDHSSSAPVTLPREDVLRLTTLRYGDSECFDTTTMEHSSSSNNHCNNIAEDSPEIQTMQNSGSDHTTVTLPTEQILSLTMIEPQTSTDTLALNDTNDNTTGNPNENANSSSSRSDRSTATKSSKSSSRKKTRTGKSEQGEHQHQHQREKPTRTKSSGSSKLKKAVKNEKKSVDAVVAAAIQKYGAPEGGSESNSPKGGSPRKSRTTPKRTKSSSSSSGKKKKSSSGQKQRRSKKPTSSGDNRAVVSPSPPSTEDPTYVEPSVDDEHASLPMPPFQEAISSASFRSIDRAGAIAVFPSESEHATQRRSVTDHRRISDNNNNNEYVSVAADLFGTNDVEAQAHTQSCQREDDFDSTNRTYDEIPEPPRSQVIHATSTYHQDRGPTGSPTNAHAHEHAQTHSSALSTVPGHYAGSSSSATAPTASSMDSATADKSGSGTVTAKAISTENYYAEVRRQLREEAVVAVDVIPLNEDGQPIKNGSNVQYRNDDGFYKRNGSSQSERDKDRNVTQKIRRKNIWIVVFVGLLLVMIGILVPVTMRPAKSSLSTNENENPSEDDGEMDMDEIKAMMDSEMGVFWRKRISNVLPKAQLVNILNDPDYSSPQYKAFIFLVRNAEELFGIDLADKKKTEDPFSRAERTKITTVFGLVTLYYAMQGEKWFVRNNWLDATADICEWHGVHCIGELMPKDIFGKGNSNRNTNGNTNGNPFPNDNFGIIPPPAGDLNDDGGYFDKDTFNDYADDEPAVAASYSLNADDDVDDVDEDVGGSIEEGIAILSLDLSANDLCGYIPDDIGLLTNIYGMIDLSNNRIFGTIPSSLGQLTRLQGVRMHSNELESSLPRELEQMTKMRLFDISKNSAINGTFPTALESWTKIEQLQVQGTNLKGLVSYDFCDMLRERETLDFKPFRFKYEDELIFRASCPSPLDCPCCTECCYEVDGIEFCNQNYSSDRLTDD